MSVRDGFGLAARIASTVVPLRCGAWGRLGGPAFTEQRGESERADGGDEGTLDGAVEEDDAIDGASALPLQARARMIARQGQARTGRPQEGDHLVRVHAALGGRTIRAGQLVNGSWPRFRPASG